MTSIHGTRIEERIAPASEPLACGPNPQFGRHFTPAMLAVEYSEGEGWARGRIEKKGPLPIDPSCIALNYGQSVFEGLKAYKQPDGKIALFRVRDHALRFERSCRRVALPDFPPDAFVDLVSRFVRHQARSIPDGPEIALYLRPLLIGTEAGLGIRASREALFLVMGAIVGPYFGGGKTSVKVRVSDEFVRAAPGGTGSAKLAGNYANGLLALSRAWGEGLDQVMYLDAVHRRNIEEMEGMNVFVVKDGALVTPPLTDTILPGVTRSSLLTIARAKEIAVREEPIAWDDVAQGLQTGRVTEMFAAGTAAVVAPIGEIRRGNDVWVLPDKRPIAEMLRKELRAIQSGGAPDPHGWRTVV
jgi:branched-chain amino acid aminotransferase